jgi:hypothetical protein
MRPTSPVSTLAVSTLLLAAAALPVAAQSADVEPLTGGFHLGYRSVSVDGDEGKYLEDVTLEDGPRLFDLALHLVPDEGALAEWVDRVDLDISSLGGDPYESMRLGIERHDRFDLSYSRTRSDYVYQDLLVRPGEGDVRATTGGDFRTFDLERVQDRARLDLRLTDRARLLFGLDRFTRRGESTQPLDVLRDEYEFDRPVDESSNSTRLGLEYSWDRVTLTVQESLHRFDNDVGLFLPGFSEGQSPGPSTLDFYFLDQPWESETREHRATVVARPTNRWTVRAVGGLQDIESRGRGAERSQGEDFRGNPFQNDFVGVTRVDGDGVLVDLEATYLVTDRLGLVFGGSHRQRDQEGTVDFRGEEGFGRWDVETTGAEVGAQWSVRPGLDLGARVRWQERDVESAVGEGPGVGAAVEIETTEHLGFQVSGGWRPSPGFRLTGEVDSSSYDEPYTLVAATDRLRYRLRATWNLTDAWSLTGSVVGHEADNEDSGFDSSYDQANLRLGYRAGAFEASVGYGVLDIRHTVDQETTVGLFAIDYAAQTDLVDGRLRWRPTDRFQVEAAMLLYDNTGDFGLERDDWRLGVEHWFVDTWSVRLAYRDLDFAERASGFQEYQAEVLEVSLGHRFGSW